MEHTLAINSNFFCTRLINDPEYVGEGYIAKIRGAVTRILDQGRIRSQISQEFLKSIYMHEHTASP